MRGIRLERLFVVFASILPCFAYNLEERLPLFKYGVHDSSFGFSVALHKTGTDEAVGTGGTLMVVGAPTSPALGTPDIGTKPRNPGGVFSCPITTNRRDCDRIKVDEGGDYVDPATNISHIRSHQWLGVSLKSQGPGQYLVTCAHKYRQQFNLGTHAEKERLCGKCFLLKGGADGIKEVPPNSGELPFQFISSMCDVLQAQPIYLDTKTRLGKSQFGTSISLYNGRYVLGAPGTWAWTGALFEINIPAKGLPGPERAATPSCRVSERQTNRFGSYYCSKIPLERDSYMGFSVDASSKVDTDSDTHFYAAGAPAGNNTGAVVFFEKSRTHTGRNVLLPDMAKTVTGEKIGSSFGYSVALTDVNADGLDDLLVGAPQYYEYSSKRKIGGALYVYLNEPDKEFRDVKPKRFFGTLESYFGHSIAALGDLDQDGFNDFAVGAPYEKENGTVYIFRGGPDGPKKSQEILGSHYGFAKRDFKEIVGFGASLSGHVDVDGNKYPDLLIGSFSDSIALLRSRPIITVTSTLDVETDVIDLEKKTCTFGGKSYACFRLNYCLSYKARHAKYPAGVKLTYTVRIDNIRQQRGDHPRLSFDAPKNSSTMRRKITLQKADVRVCPGAHDIYFNNGVLDKLTDIEVKFEFELDLEEPTRESQGAPVFDLSNNPILDADVDSVKTALVRIKNTCGEDGCQSGLKFAASMPEEIVVGKDSFSTLEVHARNDREEAHQANLEIYLPPGVDFINVTIPNMSNPEMSCYSSPFGLSSFIKCHLGNPYKEGSKDTIEILLSTLGLDLDTKEIDVTIGGRTTSENPEIPHVALQAQVIVELSLRLTQSSQPDQVRYKDKPVLGETGMKTSEDIGPQIQYTFNVENTGVAPAIGVTLDIELPTEIYNGKWLLYLVASDVQAGGDLLAGTCNSTYINVLQLEPALPASSALSSRNKRSAEDRYSGPEAEALSSGGVFTSKIDLSCEQNARTSARCQSIKCALDEIPKESTTSVIMQIRLWEPTFIEEFKKTDLVYVHTEAKLTAENQNIRIVGDQSSGVITTTVDHEDFQEKISDAFPWWYILIGVVILLLIYVVVILLLIRCGFFRRKRYHRHNEDVVVAEEEDDEEKKRDEDKL